MTIRKLSDWSTFGKYVSLGMIALAVGVGTKSAFAQREAPATVQQLSEDIYEDELDDELRDAISDLHSSVVAGESTGSNRVKAWMAYETARRIEKINPALFSAVEYIVLGHFALAHLDFDSADRYLALAKQKTAQDQSKAVQALGLAAIGHLYFEHYPKTSLEEGRKLYGEAVAAASTGVDARKFYLIAQLQSDLAIAEYRAGNEAAGNAALEAAKAAFVGQNVPQFYLQQWTNAIEAQVEVAKALGGL